MVRIRKFGLTREPSNAIDESPLLSGGTAGPEAKMTAPSVRGPGREAQQSCLAFSHVPPVSSSPNPLTVPSLRKVSSALSMTRPGPCRLVMVRGTNRAIQSGDP